MDEAINKRMFYILVNGEEFYIGLMSIMLAGYIFSCNQSAPRYLEHLLSFSLKKRKHIVRKFKMKNVCIIRVIMFIRTYTFLI